MDIMPAAESCISVAATLRSQAINGASPIEWWCGGSVSLVQQQAHVTLRPPRRARTRERAFAAALLALPKAAKPAWLVAAEAEIASGVDPSATSRSLALGIGA
jgi:hypothetical protein